MRDMTSMALVVQERDRPSPKVWQPWYMDESEGGGKELPTRTHRDQRTRDRLALARPPHRTTPSPERGCFQRRRDQRGGLPAAAAPLRRRLLPALGRRRPARHDHQAALSPARPLAPPRPHL
nr:uncharacterized protein LOC113807276 [Penaeus vannamei]